MATTGSDTLNVGPVLKDHEWWFKDALDRMECKVDIQPEMLGPDGEPLPGLVEFYEGRLYRKEGRTDCKPGEWIPIPDPEDGYEEDL